MKAQGAVVMGSLAVVTLGMAYLTWQRPPETRTDTVAKVLDASKTSLQKIHYEDGTRFLDLTRVVDGEPVVWLKQGYLDGKAPVFDAGTGTADAGADGGASRLAPPPPPVIPTRELRGNEFAEKEWERFAPFEGVRALGVLSDAKLKELELDASPKLLVLTVAGTPHSFKVNSSTTGLIGQYVMDVNSKEVFLLGSGALNKIDPSSNTLIDRRLHVFKSAEFDAFTVTMSESGQHKDFVQTDAQIAQTAKVAPKETPNKPDEFAKNWHDKVWNRIIVTEVLGKGEKPAGGEPAVLLRVDYSHKGKPKGWIELARIPTQSTQVYGRTENTAGWVALHAGVEELALEAKKLVTGK